MSARRRFRLPPTPSASSASASPTSASIARRVDAPSPTWSSRKSSSISSARPINSGRSILLYGPPGNGKTSVAEKIGSIFNDVIYIPYCFEVEGQIIKVFDPSIHKRASANAERRPAATLRREDFDRRWVACRRPFIVTGGELTLEMLDLSFNALAKFYEAPLHVKALGGTFVIDDFGRQLVSPEALLNRWIVPLESRVEYLKLHTGKSFSLPFDELVIFSTNLSPQDLMDPAFLRRIPYKLEIAAPDAARNTARYSGWSRKAAGWMPRTRSSTSSSKLREHNDFPLARYQPRSSSIRCRQRASSREFRAFTRACHDGAGQPLHQGYARLQGSNPQADGRRRIAAIRRKASIFRSSRTRP